MMNMLTENGLHFSGKQATGGAESTAVPINEQLPPIAAIKTIKYIQ